MAWQDEVVAALGATERSSAFDRATWAKAEAEIGSVLPPGYKSLIDRLGAGCIGDYLWLVAPSHVNRALDFADNSKHAIKCYSIYQETDPIEFARPSPPKKGAVLPFACTVGGDYISFICGPGNPDNWPVAFCHDGASCEAIYAAGVAEFFFEIVEKRLQGNGFPPSFLDQEMRFVSHET